MNKRVVIFIGAGLILLGVAALVFFGYKVFYLPSVKQSVSQQFYLEQEEHVVNSAAHNVVVKGVLYPGAASVAEWPCLVRVWDWGDGEKIKDSSCIDVELVGDVFLVYPGEHKYATSGQYSVKLYVWGPDGKTYVTQALSVQAQ